MRIKDGFLLKQIVDTYVVMPVGDNLVDFSAMISLNETGAFLWEQMVSHTTTDELAEKMCLEYNIDKETALNDINEFIETLESQNIIEK